jgi:hypothetical protein
MEARATMEPDVTAPEEAGHDEAAELTMALARIKQFIETSAVEEARALAKEVVARWPEDGRAQYWARVLAPAKGRVVPGRRSRPLDRERAWLREHAHEYRGQWLAIFGDQLLAADKSLANVMKVVRETPGAEDALLHFQGPHWE